MSISRETKPHKCPVGTIRSWQKGMVIKLHEATDFHNGWYDLPDFPVLTALGEKLNRLALQFTKVKSPVNGEKFLDEVITNFQREEGEQAGPFIPQDFKQYEGYYGAPRYSFVNEFNKRAMGLWQEMYEEIQTQLGRKRDQNGGTISDDEIKFIKSSVRALYKLKLQAEVDVTQFRELADVIVANHKHLMEAVDLSPELSDKYTKFLSKLDEILAAKATDYFNVVDWTNEAKQFSVENFSGNWILFQSALDAADEAFEKYLSKNSASISEFIKQESVKRFDIDVFADAKDFYSDLLAKIQNVPIKESLPNLNDLSGEFDIELNGVKGRLSVLVQEQNPEIANSNIRTSIAGTNKIIDELVKFTGAAVFSKDEKTGIGIMSLNGVNKYSLERFFSHSEIGATDLNLKRLVSLLAIIGKYPKPTADCNPAYKRYYLTAQPIESYYKGEKLNFQIGFKRSNTFENSKQVLFEQPMLELFNKKDAKKIQDVFIKKMTQTGFSKEVAKQQFDKYVENNQFPLDKYDLNIIFTDLQHNNVFEKAKLDFKPVLQMRFNTKYKKQIEGDWNKNNIVALETIERVMDDLPLGHVINNKEFVTIRHDSEYNGNYASYHDDRKMIQFSKDCLASTSRETVMNGSSHFASVVVHEFGHAVSRKIGGYAGQDYRKFANECGWSYKEERTKDSATGNDVRIPRNGSNGGRQLITDYATVSPEEAFAEYYSFYHLNKEAIDKYLDTGDSDFVKKHVEQMVTNEKKLKYQVTPIENLGNVRQVYTGTDNKMYDMVQRDFIKGNFSDELDHKITSISPWKIKFEKPYAADATRNLLREYRNSSEGAPAFVIDNGNGTYESIEGRPAYNQDNIIEANRFAQRNQPVVTISRRAYDKLSEKYPGDVIVEMMAKKFKSQQVPEAQKIENVETTRTGLYYDGKVVDHAIITSNRDIFEQLSKIYHSDGLKKAVGKIFEKGKDQRESANLSAVSAFFKPFTDTLGNIIKSAREKRQKRNYADLLIITRDLRLLLVQRNKNDDFMPFKLAVPGGKIEYGEVPLNAAIRETFEEINVVFEEDDLKFIKTVDNGDSTKTYYYYTVLPENYVLEDHIVLDANELTNYHLVSIDKIVNGAIDSDLFILDLAKRLQTMLVDDGVLTNVIEKPELHLVNMTPEVEIATGSSALSYLMYNFDRQKVDEDTFIQTLIDNKDMFDDMNKIVKGKTPFPIGSLDKNRKNVKTAAGWVPLKGNHHLVSEEYKHMLADTHVHEKVKTEEIKQVDAQEEATKDINLPAIDNDGSLKNAEEVSEKPKRVPSPQQQGVFKFIQEGTGNGIIDAKAGSGKTTTIVDAMGFIPKGKKTIFVAFSKAIQEELKPRIPEGNECSTLHAFGFAAIKKVYGKYVKVEKDKKKLVLNDFIDKVATEENLEPEEKIEYMSNVYRLISIGQQNLTADPQRLMDEAEKLGLAMISTEARYVRTCMIMLDKRTDMIDFDDMVYLPSAYDKFNIPKYDYVFVDECQDLNKAQLKLMTKMFDPQKGGRFVAVGDPQQAIFGFAGSDHNSFENIANLPNTTRLPLSVSYRCPKAVVAYAKQKTGVPIDFWEKSPEGKVDADASINNIDDGDMVICRNTAPLVALCMKFIGDKKAAYIRGRDIGETMINEIKRYVGTKLLDTEEGFKNMFLRIDREIEKITKRQQLKGLTKEQALESTPVVNLVERKECYQALRGDSVTPNEMIQNIQKIFSESAKGGIQLTTGHRSKGLEANNVFVVEDELLHGGRAKNDFQKIQENNLRYVVYTRAKQTLNIVTDWSFYDKQKKIQKAIEVESINSINDDSVEKTIAIEIEEEQVPDFLRE